VGYLFDNFGELLIVKLGRRMVKGRWGVCGIGVNNLDIDISQVQGCQCVKRQCLSGGRYIYQGLKMAVKTDNENMKTSENSPT